MNRIWALKRHARLIAIAGVSSCLAIAALMRLGYLPPLRALPALPCLGECVPDPRIHTPPSAGDWVNADRPLTALLPNPQDTAQTSILIEKSRYRLTLYYRGQPVKSYPVVFGDPVGDKLREGDRKTPEGILRIQDLYPHPSWGSFLWLDYPTKTSWRKHYQAKTMGKIPRSASIGGEVGIHGVPEGNDNWVDRRQNWTLGCPSVKSADIAELYSAVQVGTIVEIIP